MNFKHLTIYWIQNVIVDLFIPDFSFIPTELFSDFFVNIAAKIVDFVLRNIFGKEFAAEYLNTVKKIKIPKKYYVLSTGITAVLELDPTGIVNNTLGIFINPYSIYYYRLCIDKLK